jgi:hypothetical protein
MPGTTIIIISPSPPPGKPKSTRLVTVRQHLEAVLSGDTSYTVIERATGWKDRLLALSKSWTARFNALVALASGVVFMAPDIITAAASSVGMLKPVIGVEHLAILTFSLSVATTLFRSRTLHKQS